MAFLFIVATVACGVTRAGKVMLTKISRLRLSGIVVRADCHMGGTQRWRNPWCGYAARRGCGKASPVDSCLAQRQDVAIWYRVDGGKEDRAASFCLLSLAAWQVVEKIPAAMFIESFECIRTEWGERMCEAGGKFRFRCSAIYLQSSECPRIFL